MAVSEGTWKPLPGDTCSVEGCDRPRKLIRDGHRGLSGRYQHCGAHRRRIERYGDPQADKPVGGFNPALFISYAGAHSRTRSRRGPASAHVCSCGKPATGWAYQGGAEHEFSGVVLNSEMRWSGDPEDYAPMCSRCHKGADLAVRRAHFAAVEAENAALRDEIAALRAENEALRGRVSA